MTYQPQTWKDVQAYLRVETGLPAVSLGLQHFAPEGGGYHEGNDLLARAGRLTTDYSKRESDRDRPGSDGSNAIDIGWFEKTLHNGRKITLITLNQWLVNECSKGAPDTLWIREIIYTEDRRTVKRWDRLKIRTTGDSSHLSHTHISGFRDNETTPKVNLFRRFFREMRGVSDVGGFLARLDIGGESSFFLSDGFKHKLIIDWPQHELYVSIWGPDKVFTDRATFLRCCGPLDTGQSATLSPEQIDDIVDGLSTHLVIAPQTPLGPDDKPAIKQALREVLIEGTEETST